MIGSKIMPVGAIDGPTVGALPNAVNWVSDLLFGPLATAIAVIAIACVGFSMLLGRINVRRGLSVVLGCFLLFGARATADGMRSIAGNDSLQSMSVSPPPTVYPSAPLPGNNSNAFDPYAGTAILPSER